MCATRLFLSAGHCYERINGFSKFDTLNNSAKVPKYVNFGNKCRKLIGFLSRGFRCTWSLLCFTGKQSASKSHFQCFKSSILETHFKALKIKRSLMCFFVLQKKVGHFWYFKTSLTLKDTFKTWKGAYNSIEISSPSWLWLKQLLNRMISYKMIYI